MTDRQGVAPSAAVKRVCAHVAQHVCGLVAKELPGAMAEQMAQHEALVSSGGDLVVSVQLVGVYTKTDKQAGEAGKLMPERVFDVTEQAVIRGAELPAVRGEAAGPEPAAAEVAAVLDGSKVEARLDAVDAFLQAVANSDHPVEIPDWLAATPAGRRISRAVGAPLGEFRRQVILALCALAAEVAGAELALGSFAAGMADIDLGGDGGGQ